MASKCECHIVPISMNTNYRQDSRVFIRTQNNYSENQLLPETEKKNTKYANQIVDYTFHRNEVIIR